VKPDDLAPGSAGWIEEPSEYELALGEAVASVAGVTHRVICPEHGVQIGEIRYSPVGPVFMADIPIESGSGIGKHMKRLREASGSRPPPAVYWVRYLIDRGDEAPDPPKAWCRRGRHRFFLQRSDFLSDSGGKILIEPN
jgi:hypothetical protein